MRGQKSLKSSCGPGRKPVIAEHLKTKKHKKTNQEIGREIDREIDREIGREIGREIDQEIDEALRAFIARRMEELPDADY